MLATPSELARIRKSSGRSASSEEIARRTRQLLQREIGFIPSPAFRELDAEQAWKQELERRDEATDAQPLRPGPERPRMPSHLEQLCSAPLLSAAEERDLFRRMNYLKYRANAVRATLDGRRPSASRLTEIERLQAAANHLRNRIVQANVRLVVSIVKQLSDDRNPFDDMLSEGISCLMKAVEKFDFDRGFRFSTYATRAVRREVFRLVQRRHRDRARFLSGSSEVLAQQVQSEESPERDESSLLHVDRSVTEMLGQLDQRERFIVQARYGFSEIGQKPTFQRLGELLGVSKERVRQLEQRALAKLREMAGVMRLEPIE